MIPESWCYVFERDIANIAFLFITVWGNAFGCQVKVSKVRELVQTCEIDYWRLDLNLNEFEKLRTRTKQLI